MVDLSVGRPCLDSYDVHGVVHDGAMVEKREEREYKAQVGAGGYEFWQTAVYVETFGRLKTKFMKLLRKLCDSAETASKGAVNRLAVKEYTLRCISV